MISKIICDIYYNKINKKNAFDNDIITYIIVRTFYFFIFFTKTNT